MAKSAYRERFFRSNAKKISWLAQILRSIEDVVMIRSRNIGLQERPSIALRVNVFMSFIHFENH